MALDISYEEAQQAIDAGDEVTTSEIQEIYPDKTMNEIEYDMAIKEAELELSSKMAEIYAFNEPRAAAKQGKRTYRTGSKGVITDYEEAKLKLRANRLKNKIQKENKYYMNIGNNSNETTSKLMIIDMEKNKVTKKQLRTEGKASESDSNSDSDSEDLDNLLDEEILLQYKLEKMKILSDNRNRYGQVKEITYLTFNKQVIDTPHNVFVVIHIYQDYLERCVRMNYALTQIAKSYPNIKFLRARSDRLALHNYPQIGLPTFIIFKNGKQLQNHIAVHQLIGNPPQVKHVEAFLINNKIIQPIVVIPDIKINANKNIKDNSNNNDDDSDSELDLD